MMALAELLSGARPIIGHIEWVESITPEMKQRIEIERLKQIKNANGNKINIATDYEACVYMSTLSLAQPLGRVAYNIYCYLFKQFYPEQAKEIFEEYELKRELDHQENSELLMLKHWLYKTSVRECKKCGTR